MHEDWQDSEGTRGYKYQWGMDSKARRMVADHVKTNGGALKDRIPDLFELAFGQRQATWCVCEYVFVFALMTTYLARREGMYA